MQNCSGMSKQEDIKNNIYLDNIKFTYTLFCSQVPCKK